MRIGERIYLDHQATTPCDPRVIEAMAPLWGEAFANPHSADHAPGRAAAVRVERARAQVAALIGAEPREIVFTSGATEANNLAIKGIARHARRTGDPRRRIVTFATEHACVRESVLDLREEGFEPVILGVGADGRPDSDTLRAALAVPTLLVSVMAVNNETGVIADIPALAACAAEAGAVLHCDAAQAAGRVAIDLHGDWSGVGALSLSAHKIHGPKGIGALFVRHRPRVRLSPLFSGGGQERLLRSGTLPAPLVAGFGVAAEFARLEGAADDARAGALCARLLARLSAEIGPEAGPLIVNGSRRARIGANLNLRLPGVAARDLLAAAPLLCASRGSACGSGESGDAEGSPVLAAMGLDRRARAESLRLSPGRFTTDDDIDTAAHLLAAAWRACRLTVL